MSPFPIFPFSLSNSIASRIPSSTSIMKFLFFPGNPPPHSVIYLPARVQAPPPFSGRFSPENVHLLNAPPTNPTHSSVPLQTPCPPVLRSLRLHRRSDRGKPSPVFLNFREIIGPRTVVILYLSFHFPPPPPPPVLSLPFPASLFLP